MYCFSSILVLTSVKQFGIIHIEKDKRDGDIGQISQWFPFCLYGYIKCRNHFNGGNWGGFYMFLSRFCYKEQEQSYN